MLEIVIDSTFPYFSQTTTIENKAYQLEFIWNERDKRWRFSLLNMNDEYLIKNIKLVPILPLIGRYKIQNIFTGDFVCVDTQGNTNLPKRDNLGTDFKFYYMTKEELKSKNLDKLL